MRNFLLIDGMSISHAVNNGSQLSIGDQPTQAIYGFLRKMRPMMDIYRNYEPVVLWDGMSWRKLAYADYKANRDKPAVSPHEVKAKKLKDDLKLQLPFIRQSLKLLGIKQMVAHNYEADDLAGLLVAKYAPQGRRICLITADEDWIQLIGPKVSWRDPIHGKFVTNGTIMKEIGVPSPAAHLEVKGLCGDMGDNIPGVGGIGKKGAHEFIEKYGSIGAFFNQCTDKTIDIAKLPKKFRDFYLDDAKHDLYRRNMRLMDLSTKERPEPVNLKLTKGAFDPVAFRAFCDQFLFASITNKLDEWVAPFGPQEEALAA